jgi:hypothetical protein
MDGSEVANALLETEVPCAETLECRSICANDIGIERICGRHQPGIVLAKSSGQPALQQCASARLREVESMNGKALQCRHRGGYVAGALEDLFDRYNRNDQPALPQGGQKPSRWTESVA